ncbi:MAG: hypothetical protein H6722_32595 [Sandaracinus sp.]|nr:hypothetical protein [Sandaracinus sp.]MCB9613082.1 hypothetical protein [Sandaracinus sp.]MCB9617195.1 hypothetical protein [Sandaracinus sp.]MCB9624631.1 hypothetical protein [Sandaracinus sp.]
MTLRTMGASVVGSVGLAVAAYLVFFRGLLDEGAFVVEDPSGAWFDEHACGLTATNAERLRRVHPGTVFEVRGERFEKDARCWRIRGGRMDEVWIFVFEDEVLVTRSVFSHYAWR